MNQVSKEQAKLDELADDVLLAEARKEEAEQDESYARSKSCSARNRLSDAQKAFDKAVEDFRKKWSKS